MSKKQDLWDSMTPAQRRVAIATDARDQVAAGKYQAKAAWGYIRGKTGKTKKELSKLTTKQQCDVVAKTCTMCARGALLLSRIAKFNKLNPVDIQIGAKAHTNWRNTVDGLDGAFTTDQLAIIERAFERWYHEFDQTAYLFGCDHDDDTDRLLAILQNIIDHGGDFRPEVRYVTYWKRK